MRRILRGLFFVMAALGFVLAIIYPFAAGKQQGRELARWQALDERGDFIQFETKLPASEDQVRVAVEVETAEPTQALGDAVVLTLTAGRGQTTEFAQVFRLSGAEPRAQPSPSGKQRFVLHAPVLRPVRDEPYRFVFTEGEVEQPFSSVQLVLVGGTYAYDASVPPIGYGMIALGMLGMLLTRRSRNGAPAQKTAPRKWGRG